eukprot:2268800-Pleurochrysis_carterae.AAC.1
MKDVAKGNEVVETAVATCPRERAKLLSGRIRMRVFCYAQIGRRITQDLPSTFGTHMRQTKLELVRCDARFRNSRPRHCCRRRAPLDMHRAFGIYGYYMDTLESFVPTPPAARLNIKWDIIAALEKSDNIPSVYPPLRRKTLVHARKLADANKLIRRTAALLTAGRDAGAEYVFEHPADC